MSVARVVAALAIIAALAVALVLVLQRDGDDGASVASPGPSLETTEAGPSAAPSPTATPLAVPTPDTTGRDFDRIIREIFAFENWLFANPDPELLDLVVHPECECYAEGVERLEQLQQRNLAFRGQTLRIESVEVAQEFDPVVRLRVVVSTPSHDLVDATGTVVDSVEASGPVTLSITLVMGGDDRWRINTTTVIE